jgi:hypothetical protein
MGWCLNEDGAMRPLLLIALLAVCGVARGQDQERKLLERIQNPDTSITSSFQGKAYYGGSDKQGYASKEANVKDFYFVQKFTSKGYEAKAFDAKSFWGGDFQFTTKDAYTKDSSNAGKVYDTKGADVKTASEAGKEYAANGKAYETKSAPDKGKTSQNHLEEMHKDGSEKMNIDQVRDLLNKPPL